MTSCSLPVIRKAHSEWVRNPNRTVVKFSGESHAVKGLFVADASLFPTSIGVPPTLTIAALAEHVASQIIESGIV